MSDQASLHVLLARDLGPLGTHQGAVADVDSLPRACKLPGHRGAYFEAVA